ncbi:AI-2E family transporter [Alphaproteobacteria bacterium]|nr:AI-2E family transporter [Alphaproteobacteria bacterium]
MSALMNPCVKKMQKYGLPRSLVTFLLIFLIVFHLISLATVLSFYAKKYFSLYQHNLRSLIVSLATWTPQKINQIAAFFHIPLKVDPNAIHEYLTNSLGDILESIIRQISTLYTHARSVVNAVTLAVFAPILTFYVTKDWEKLVAKTREYTPDRLLAFADFVLPNVKKNLKQQFAGQTKVSFIVMILYSVGLFFIGINPFLLLGFISGLLTFIPFLGAFVALLFALLVALGQDMGCVPIVSLGVLYFSLSSLESNFLTPKFVGRKIGLHPVWIFFAVLMVMAWLGLGAAFFVLPLATLTWSFIQSTLAWIKKEDDEGR